MEEMGTGDEAVELDGSASCCCCVDVGDGCEPEAQAGPGGGAAKLGQVPRLRCSEAVRDGLEAEKTAEQSAQRSLTALGGMPVSAGGMRTGSRCAQYQAPLPLTALARTVRRAS